MSDRLKIGQEVLIHGYVDEIRKDTVIIRNDGGYFGTVEYEVTDIEYIPDMIAVLEKIRAEIEQAIWEDVVVSLDGTDEVRIPRLDPDDVFEIIEKYRAGK